MLGFPGLIVDRLLDSIINVKAIFEELFAPSLSHTTPHPLLLYELIQAKLPGL